MRGRNRIVRRLLAAAGFPVGIGAYRCRLRVTGKQRPGSIRALRSNEIGQLYQTVGLWSPKRGSSRDRPAGWKSSVSKAISARLGALSGHRGNVSIVTLAVLRASADPSDIAAVETIASTVQMSLGYDPDGDSYLPCRRRRFG